MVTFRDALIGVWCLSWQPGSGDLCFEPLAAVLRHNRHLPAGARQQCKGILALFGHQASDTLAMQDAFEADLHSANPAQACASFRLSHSRGWQPMWYPVGIESAERWAWLMQTA